MAIEKVTAAMELRETSEANHPEARSESNQIFIKDGEQCWLVKVGDVTLFEIVGNYTRVYFNEEKPLLYKSLNKVEEKLPPRTFFRANRQQIININFIQQVVPSFNGKLKITLKNDTEIEVSRRQSYIFRDKMSL